MKTRFIAVVALIASTCAIGQVQAQDEGPDVGKYIEGERQGSMRINVDLDGVDLADVMEQIGRQVGRNILVDPNVEEIVRVSLRDIPWREAVDVIARMTRCEVEERPGGILLLTQPPKVTIQFTDANVRTVLQLLAAYSGKNIIISPEVRGNVTLDLKEVHWLRALHAIVKTVGDFEVVEETEDLLRVVTRSSIEQQLETHVFKLKFVRPPAIYRAVPPATAGGGASAASAVFVGRVSNAAAADITQTFTLFRSLANVITVSNIAGATLEYDEQTNAFIITATKPLISQVKKIVEKVDLEPAQVYAEVKFVSTTDGNVEDTGISFSDDDATTGLRWSTQEHGPFPSGVTFGGPGYPNGLSTPDTAGQLTAEQMTPGAFPFLIGEGMESFRNAFRLPAILNFGQLELAMNLIDRDERSRVVQSPSLFMLDNQDAVIFVGEQVPYVEITNTQDASGNVQAAIEEGDRSPVAIGFSLFLQPHVIPDTDRIALTVIPRVNELTGSSSPVEGFERFIAASGAQNLALDLPRTREQALVTHVMLEDTNTAVLGGLLAERQTEIIKRIPIISSLPLIGNLFTRTQTSHSVDSLTIFITPTIIRPSQRSTLDSIFMRATRRIERADYFYKKYEKPAAEDEASEEYELDDE